MQNVYFNNPSTINSIDQGVNSLTVSQGIRTSLNTGAYDYISLCGIQGSCCNFKSLLII